MSFWYEILTRGGVWRMVTCTHILYKNSDNGKLLKEQLDNLGYTLSDFLAESLSVQNEAALN